MNGVQQLIAGEVIFAGIVATVWIARGYSGNPFGWGTFGMVVDSIILWLMFDMHSDRPWQFWLFAVFPFTGFFINLFALLTDKVWTYKESEKVSSMVSMVLIIAFELYLVANLT